MRTIKNNNKLGIFLIILSALGYGLMPIFTIYALQGGTDVFSLLFGRFAIAALILWLYIWRTQKTYWLSLKHTLYLVTICLLGYTIASVAIYHAYARISGSVATLILFTHPFFVLLMEKLFTKTRITSRKITAMVIVTLGLGLVLYQKEVNFDIYGILLSFIASVTYGIFCFGLNEKETQRLDGIVITAYMATVTSITTGLQCLIFDKPLIPADATGIWCAVGLAIFSTLLASVTFYEGLSIVGPSSATVISSFEPVFVVLLSAWLLHETMSLRLIIGGVIIILGIILMEYKVKKSIKNVKRDIS